LQLTWDRVDFHRGTINLDDPERDRTQKGRARVAMNPTVRDALIEARRHATSPFVVEFEGKQIQSIKGALKRAAERADLEASPYVLRHTAAVWMAEDGVPIPEIAQILGHTDVNTTYRVYARFSPQHQQRAVASLQVVRGSARRGGDYVKPTFEQPCCTRDEGGPLGPGLQDQGSNHRKLLRHNGWGGERCGKGGSKSVRCLLVSRTQVIR
jgi:Phage integrase family